jgi:lipoprotein-anchoring transpeptidase ErfK/SrfK
MSRRFVLSAVGIAVVVLALGVAVATVLDSSKGEDVAAAEGTESSAGASTTTPPTTAPPTTAPPTTAPTTTSTASTVPPAELLPADSGEGRRVVFSVGGQRMWWVDETGVAIRTALVSGRPNTPQLGTFSVYSRTEHATGLDGSKMDYFVRFTKGPNGWAIGFHDIPEMNGVPVQTDAELGQPLSHGCIRQSQADAEFTWSFLQVGDTVVVVA